MSLSVSPLHVHVVSRGAGKPGSLRMVLHVRRGGAKAVYL